MVFTLETCFHEVVGDDVVVRKPSGWAGATRLMEKRQATLLASHLVGNW